ncbi:monocarboxylate transporter 13-like [Argonauta hians]
MTKSKGIILEVNLLSPSMVVEGEVEKIVAGDEVKGNITPPPPALLLPALPAPPLPLVPALPPLPLVPPVPAVGVEMGTGIVNPAFCDTEQHHRHHLNNNNNNNNNQELDLNYNQTASVDKLASQSDKSYLPLAPRSQQSSPRSSFLKYLAYISILYNNVLGYGVAYSLGILYIYWIREYNTSKSETAMITSACGATLGGGGIFAGMLYRKIGVCWAFIVAAVLCSVGLIASSFAPNIWFLFFSLGILFGSGAAINNIVGFAALEKIFHKNVQIPAIILTISSPIGVSTVPYLMNSFLNLYSWRGALLILSGFCLNMCFSGLLSNIVSNHQCHPKTGRLKVFNGKIFRNKRFLLLSSTGSLNTCFGSLVLLLIADFWVEKGHSDIEGIALLSFVGTASISSRFVFTFFSVFFNTEPVLIFIFYIVSFTSTLFFLLSPLCNTYTPMIFLAMINGFSRGMSATVRPLVFKKVVGAEDYPLAMGFTFSVSGLCTIPMATLVGTLTDITQSYKFAFYLTGLFEVLTYVVLISCDLLASCHKRDHYKFKQQRLG